MLRWVLSVVVGGAALGAIVAILRADICPDAEDGEHHDVFCFRDTDFGQVTFHRCLHCFRATPGIETPWIRRRTHPTLGR